MYIVSLQKEEYWAPSDTKENSEFHCISSNVRIIDCNGLLH